MSTKEAAAPGDVIIIHPPVSEPDAPDASGTPVADVIQDNQVTTIILTDGVTAPSTQPTPTPQAAPVKEKGERATGVDVFRGLFMLLMTFAMTIPMRAHLFPDWMYHMQYPPPGTFVDRPGLAWRDILFPGFLFTMCTAIPITNSLRLGKGLAYPEILWYAVRRFFLLYVFALILGHVNPYWTHDMTKRGNLVAIAGFLACWPLFLRRPSHWNATAFRAMKIAGWAITAGILFLLPRLYGITFSLERTDPIMNALAFVSLVSTALWLFTRTRPSIRLAAFAMVVAMKVSADRPGFVHDAWDQMQLFRMFKPWMLELLIVGIPGTFAGDLAVRWMKQRGENMQINWSRLRLAALAAVCVAFVAVELVGFYNQQIGATFLAVCALSAAGCALVMRAQTPRERVLATLFYGGALLMIAGTLVEPLGGFRKAPQTLSFLVFMTGSSICLLIAMMIVTDVLKIAKRATSIVEQVGQNPLLAYVVYMMFLNHILWVTNAGNILTSTWYEALIRSTLITALSATLVIAATRRKLLWRA